MENCETCYANDMAPDEVDNPCWNCKAGHSEYSPKPQTNADKIRSMTDEELAASRHMLCPYIRDEYDECKFGWHTPTQTCEECKPEWLQSPATK